MMTDRLGFQIMPMVSVDSHILKWEIKDNYTGLQQVRGLNGQPTRVKRIGHNMYEMVPGAYGEFVDISEEELTSRRKTGTFGEPIDITDLVSEAEEHLEERELDRAENIIWTLLTTGTFSVSSPLGYVLHTDVFPIQTFTAGVPWATFATAVPLQNFRDVQLLSPGKGVSFGAQARAIMSRVTLNNMLSNSNQLDIAGRRVSGLTTVLSLGEINSILLNEDLPQIQVYDEG